MRQVVESIALTSLCSLKDEIKIYKKKGKKQKIHFYSHFINKEPDAKSFLAMKYLELNAEELRINEYSIQILIKFKELYNNYSHPSELGLATMISFATEGKTFICGNYDEGKKEEYKKELQFRIEFCSVLPNIIEWLIERSKELPNQ